MASQRTGIVLELSADPKQAQAAIDEVKASVQGLGGAVVQSNERVIASQRSMAQVLKDMGVSAAQATENYRLNGVAAEQAANEIAAAYGSVGPAIEEGVKKSRGFGGALRENLGDLRGLRQAFYSVFFFTAAAYIVPQIREIVQQVETLSLAIGGFSLSAQRELSQQIKFNQKLLGQNEKALEEDKDAAVRRVNEIADEIASVKQRMEKGGPLQILHPLKDVPEEDQLVTDLRVKLADLQKQLQSASDAENAANLALAEYQDSHKKAAHAVKVHADSVAHLRDLQKSMSAFDPLGNMWAKMQAEQVKNLDAYNANLTKERDKIYDFVDSVNKEIQGKFYGLSEKSYVQDFFARIGEAARKQQMKMAHERARDEAKNLQEFLRAVRKGGEFRGMSFDRTAVSVKQFNQNLRESLTILGMAMPQRLTRMREVTGALRSSFSDLSAEQWKNATINQKLGQVMKSSTLEAVTSSAASVAQLIAGKKAAAKIEGAYFLAEGAYHLAEGIWPPNPGLIARGVGEIAAGLQMEGVGGGGGGSASGGGGGGRAAATGGRNMNQSPYTGGPGSGSGGRGQNYPGQGPTVHVHLYGDYYGGQAGMQEFVAQINDAVRAGTMTLTASNALRNGPKYT